MFEVQMNKMREINTQKDNLGHEIADFINNQIEELRDNGLLILDEFGGEERLDSVYWDEKGQTLRFVIE